MPKYVNIGLDEMDEFLVEAQGFDRIDGDERREMHLDQGIPYVESGERFEVQIIVQILPLPWVMSKLDAAKLERRMKNPMGGNPKLIRSP